MRKFFIFLFLLTGAVSAYSPSIMSFNSGQVSPLMEARADFQKYTASSRLIENMLVTVQGPVLKRPGTKYIATAKTGQIRLLPFEISTDDSYIIEAGTNYMRFYRDGGQILDSGSAVEISTVFDADELSTIQDAMTDDTMYLVDGTDPPQILTRTSHTTWTIADLDFQAGPFLPENETTTTITPTGYSFTDDETADTFAITGNGDLSDLFPDDGTFTIGGSTDNDGSWTVSSTTFAGDPAFVITVKEDVTGTDDSGSIVVAGGVVSLAASSGIFESTSGASHVGSIWAINQVRNSSDISGSFAANTDGVSLSTPFFSGGYGFTTSGNAHGTITLQRSTNGGISWRPALTPLVDTDFDNPAETEEDGAIYRAVMSDHGAGKVKYHITITDNINKGVLQITSVASATSATATVITNLTDTDATRTWREGYWSDFRGWPKTVAFHQQRLVFGGSASYPQILWFGKQDPDDYANFLEGTLDTSAFTAALEGQNPIRWLLPQDYLIVGSSATCGVWGERGKPVTPTTPKYQGQTRYGAEPIPAVLGGTFVLYIERGGRKVREFSFNFQLDKYISPDLSILSPEITNSGITEASFQLRPDPIFWCVLANGEIATLTYQREQSVVAWTKQVTDGDFESVAIISSGESEDEVWFSVKRNGTRYIEQLQPFEWGDDQNDAWFVDSGLDYDATATTTFTGLDHLNGEMAAIWADGVVLESERVISGSITIDVSSGRVIAGLPFTAKLETLPIRADPQDMASNKKIKRIWVDFYRAGDVEFGNGANSELTPVNFFDTSPITARQDLFTSVVKLKQFSYVYSGMQKQTVYFQSSKPVPLGIRAIVLEMEIRK